VICHVSDRIDSGAPDAELDRWKNIFLSVCFRFEYLTGDDACHWRASELRQMQSSIDDAVRRTAMQLCYEIFLFKERKEAEAGRALVNKDIRSLYAQKSNIAESNKFEGDHSHNWVDTCILLTQKLFSDPVCKDVILKMEAKYGLQSGLNALSKLNIVVSKTDTVEQRRWVLCSMWDMMVSGSCLNENVTRSHLQGTGGSPSAVTTLVFRKECLDHFLDIELPKNGYAAGDLQLMREPLSSHKSFRALCRGFDDAAVPADVKWQAKLSAASLAALRLLEDLLLEGLRICVIEGRAQPK
jgi:hypothetical protein